ncbi:hypothetical protein LJC60_04135 [Ruminococcaceae bacterium OttesenSCG-928-D13]|nr:hypothetical protein [Ruminococcaceae bacterium OttesenSCG-928-D13]
MIKPNNYRLNKFNGYTLEDCDCKLCLHYAGKGKPCPLETCCCEDEKREAIARASATPDLPPLRRRIDPLQPEKPVCFDKPECAGCAYPGHGFLCGGADGACLKTIISRRGGLSPCPA